MWSIAWILELTIRLELHKWVAILMGTWHVCFEYCVEVTNANNFILFISISILIFFFGGGN